MAIEGLDLEALLAPINGELPTGIDVRTDFSPTSTYFRLRDARADARAAERAADANPGAEGGLADGWRTVRTLAVQALSEQAKDLEIASWLTESLVRSHGLLGLAFGADVLAGLADRYWDQLYPMPDEDGLETRVAPITGLNGEGGADGTLVQPLLKLPLFSGPAGEPILLFQYNQSAELETISDAKRLESRLNAGVMPYEQMQSVARGISPGIFIALRKALREAQASWQTMGAVLDRVAGSYSPPTRRIAETLDLIATITARYGPPEHTALEDNSDVAAQGADGAVETAPSAAATKPKRLATREDALASLMEIADFFRRNEPQSPLAYTIDDAIRRGRLTWPELIRELVQDDQVRVNILSSLGIKAE